MPEEDIAVATTIEVAEVRSESRAARVAFVVGFLLLIGSIPLVQTAWELSHSEPVQVLEVLRSTPTAEGLAQYERAVEEHSVVGRQVRERWHWLSLVTLRAGNQKTVVGRGDSVFYRSSLDSAVAPGFMDHPEAEGHPVRAITAFRDCLRERGVELALLVAPGKEAIYPEWLSRRYREQDGPADNRDMPAFLDAMQRAGITVVYPAEAMWRARPGTLMYLKQDTHWTPEGMAVAADELEQALDEDLHGSDGLTIRPLQVTCNGDLYDMLGLPSYLHAPLPCQSVTVQQVIDAFGRPVEPDPQSPVVLLGDSFTNIYSLAEMGWGDHAGLGEQLALRLERRVDIIALNDGGVNSARATLVRRPDALSGKRLVIWQFAARDLVVKNGEWEIIEIAGGQRG